MTYIYHWKLCLRGAIKENNGLSELDLIQCPIYNLEDLYLFFCLLNCLMFHDYFCNLHKKKTLITALANVATQTYNQILYKLLEKITQLSKKYISYTKYIHNNRKCGEITYETISRGD